MAAERDVVYRLKVVADGANAASWNSVRQGEKSVSEAIEARTRVQESAKDKSIAASMAETKARLEGLKQTVAGWKEEQQAREKSFASERAQAEMRKQFSREAADEDKRRFDSSIRYASTQQRALDDASRSHERALGQMKAAHGQLKEGLQGTAEGFGRIVTGITMLGFAGDKNLEKLLEKLALVQGGMNLLMGGVTIYTSLTKAIEGYRAAVIATDAAQRALAAGSVGSGALRIGGSTFATTAAAGAAGGMGSGALATGGAAAGGGGLAAAGSAVAPFAAAAAALAAVAAAGVSVVETFHDIRNNGLGGGSKVGGFNDTVAGGINSFEAWGRRMIGWKRSKNPDDWDDTDQMMDSEDRVARREKANVRDRENIQRQEAFRNAFDAAVGKRQSLGQELLDKQHANDLYGLGRMPDNEKVGRALELGWKEQSLRQDLKAKRDKGGLTSSESGAIDSDLTASLDRERKLVEEREAAERRIMQVKIDSARKAIEGAETELHTVQEMINARENALKTGAERFGDMKPQEQALAIDAMTKARREGFGSLNRDQRAAIGQLSDFADVRRARSESAIADAERAFGGGEKGRRELNNLFGRGDLEATEDLRKRAGALEVSIRDNRKLEVELKTSDDNIVSSVTEQVRELMKERDEITDQKIRQAVEQLRGEISRSRGAVLRDEAARVDVGRRGVG
jgi:hypothetical protein